MANITMPVVDNNDLPHGLVELDARNLGHDVALEVQSQITFSNPGFSEIDDPPKPQIPNQVSVVLNDAVHQVLENGEQGVMERVRNLASDQQKLASKKMSVIKGFLIFFVLPLAALGIGLEISNYYMPMKYPDRISVPLFLLGITIFYGCLFYQLRGKAQWALNWRLKKTSRYLHACQVPDKYIQQMLPVLGPEAAGICHCRLAGSSSDGYGFYPSLSTNIGICVKTAPLTQDIDVNFFFDALHLQQEDLICEGMLPGFCWIRLDSQLSSFDSFVQDCLVNHPVLPGLYLSGKLISHKIGRFIPNIVEYNYPAISYSHILDGPQGKYEFDVDIVFGIKIPLWPDVAKDWPTSSNRHLPQEMIDKIVRKGCYIVHKHCDNKQEHVPIAHQEHNLDWRFTFAEAESELFKYHGKKEALKLCYVIIKFAIKRYSTKKKKTIPALKSYHLKTLFLRIAEAETQYDMFNIKNSKDLGRIFMMILSEYKRVLQQKNLPHYFMPSMNILALYTDAELQEGINLIRKLERKPLRIMNLFDRSWYNRKKLDLLITISVSLYVLTCGAFFYTYFFPI